MPKNKKARCAEPESLSSMRDFSRHVITDVLNNICNNFSNEEMPNASAFLLELKKKWLAKYEANIIVEQPPPPPPPPTQPPPPPPPPPIDPDDIPSTSADARQRLHAVHAAELSRNNITSILGAQRRRFEASLVNETDRQRHRRLQRRQKELERRQKSPKKRGRKPIKVKVGQTPCMADFERMPDETKVPIQITFPNMKEHLPPRIYQLKCTAHLLKTEKLKSIMTSEKMITTALSLPMPQSLYYVQQHIDENTPPEFLLSSASSSSHTMRKKTRKNCNKKTTQPTQLIAANVQTITAPKLRKRKKANISNCSLDDETPPLIGFSPRKKPLCSIENNETCTKPAALLPRCNTHINTEHARINKLPELDKLDGGHIKPMVNGCSDDDNNYKSVEQFDVKNPIEIIDIENTSTKRANYFYHPKSEQNVVRVKQSEQKQRPTISPLRLYRKSLYNQNGEETSTYVIESAPFVDLTLYNDPLFDDNQYEVQKADQIVQQTKRELQQTPQREQMKSKCSILGSKQLNSPERSVLLQPLSPYSEAQLWADLNLSSSDTD